MLEWKGETRLAVDDVDFVLAPTDLQGTRPAVAEGALMLRKARWMVEKYVALQSQLDARNIFELGIYEGGSTALLALLFRARRLVAVDLNTSRGSALMDFLAAQRMGESVHPYFGVDQADRTRLRGDPAAGIRVGAPRSRDRRRVASPRTDDRELQRALPAPPAGRPLRDRGLVVAALSRRRHGEAVAHR